MSRRFRIVVSALCGLLALLACVWQGNAARSEARRDREELLRRYGGEVVSLVVSTRPIEAGETIGAADVTERDWVSALAPEGAITNMDEALGHEVSVPVAGNAPVCNLNLRDASQAAEVPAGMVAVSVPITDKLGVSGTVTVGTRLVAYRVQEDATTLICQRAQVLYAPEAAGAVVARGTLSIAVASDDVPQVLEASTAGDLRLVVPADDVKSLPGPDSSKKTVDPVDAGQQGGDAGKEAESQDGQRPEADSAEEERAEATNDEEGE